MSKNSVLSSFFRFEPSSFCLCVLIAFSSLTFVIFASFPRTGFSFGERSFRPFRIAVNSPFRPKYFTSSFFSSSVEEVFLSLSSRDFSSFSICCFIGGYFTGFVFDFQYEWGVGRS